ncbi:MAG: hypothetical protein FWH27_02220 [Planctomycetaceae bacterium]|nr:hypothetical protein [Planctomycetaceae bacterium]
MKIYAIDFDVSDYQDFMFDDEAPEDETLVEKLFEFEFARLPNDWRLPSVFIPEPKLLKPNFFNVVNAAPNCMIIDEYALDKTLTVLEMSGQLFKFKYKNEKFTFFRPKHCYDCLDDENTVWKEKRMGIIKHVFNKNRITLTHDSPIFTIPELNSSTMYLADGVMSDEEEEFKYCIEKYNLKGLVLQEIWSDE